MSEETLNRIMDKLEDIEAILLLVNNPAIKEAKKILLKNGSEQRKIYELCQGRTIEEIMSITGKSQEYVNTNIRRLGAKGKIR